MKKHLTQIYLNPTGTLYQLFDSQNRYIIRIILLLGLVLLIYPSSQYGYFYYQTTELKLAHENVTATLDQKTQLLASLSQYQNEQSQKDTQLASLNQQIKQIIAQHHGQIDTLQWQFNPHKQVYLIVNQNTKNIFSMIQHLNQLNALNFKEMTLIKLNDKRLIQLNTNLVLNPKEIK